MRSENLSRKELEIATLKDRISRMSERDLRIALLYIAGTNIIPDTLRLALDEAKVKP